jgi:hypothetical protein
MSTYTALEKQRTKITAALKKEQQLLAQAETHWNETRATGYAKEIDKKRPLIKKLLTELDDINRQIELEVRRMANDASRERKASTRPKHWQPPKDIAAWDQSEAVLTARGAVIALTGEATTLDEELVALDVQAKGAETKKARRLATRQRDNALDRYNDLEAQIATAKAKLDTLERTVRADYIKQYRPVLQHSAHELGDSLKTAAAAHDDYRTVYDQLHGSLGTPYPPPPPVEMLDDFQWFFSWLQAQERFCKTK